MRAAHYLTGLLAAVLAALPAWAQDSAPPADSEEIVVERERIIDIQAAGELAKQVAGRPQSRAPLPRFNAPLCLALAIDDPERGLPIGRRVIANARTAGLKIAKPGCRPNALVIIADDMRARIDERRRSGRRFFGRLKRHQIDRALKVRDPAYVFHDLEVVSTTARGKVDRNTIINTISAAVMMENSATAGLSPEQLADYASLRLLAPTRELNEVASGAPRTILTLFSMPDNRLAEMSRFDRAYIATLYRLRSNATAVEVLRAAARSLGEGPTQGR